MKPELKTFAGNMTAIREFLDMTQKELSKRTGLTEAAISQIESGAREPMLSSAVKIMKALGVSFERMMKE